jgi:hypothetical protein
MSRHVVYFVHALGYGLVKIGTTGDIVGRFDSLERGSPVPLHLIGTLPGCGELERDFHLIAENRRHHGEWFLFTVREVAELELSLRGKAPIKRVKKKLEGICQPYRRTRPNALVLHPDAPPIEVDWDALRALEAHTVAGGVVCFCGPEDVAAVFGCTDEDLYAICDAGVLPWYQLGRRTSCRRFKPADVRKAITLLGGVEPTDDTEAA